MSLPFVAYAQSPAWSRFVLPLVALPRYIWSWLTRAEKLQQNIRGLKSSNARMFDSSSIEGPSTESRRAVDKFLKNFKADFGQRRKRERRGDSERGRQGKHAMPRGIFRLGNCDPSASFFPSSAGHAIRARRLVLVKRSCAHSLGTECRPRKDRIMGMQ